MANDTTYGENPSSFGPNGEVSQDFNEVHGDGAVKASLSPNAQQNYELVQRYGEQQLEEAKKRQQRTQPYRVQREKIKLLENYIRNPAPVPEGMQSNKNADLKIIDEQAKRMVRDQDSYKLNMIQEQTKAQLDQVMEQDRADRERTPEAQSQPPTQQSGLDRDADRERD